MENKFMSEAQNILANISEDPKVLKDQTKQLADLEKLLDTTLVKDTDLRLRAKSEVARLAPLNLRGVSVSQGKSFLGCQRRWALERCYGFTGTKVYFAVGKGVHKGLEVYSRSNKNLQLALLASKAQLIADTENYLSEYPMIEAMLTGYIDFDEKHKDYEIIDTEIEFEVLLNEQEVEDTEGDIKLAKAKGVIDFVAVTLKDLQDTSGQVIPKGSIIAGEYKTAKSAGNIDYDTDPQATLYLYALSKLLGKEVNYIVYNTLYKKIPNEPKILKSGDVSSAACVTTQEIYGNKLIEVYGSIDVAPEKCRSLHANLAASASKFFDRKYIFRSDYEKAELASRFSGLTNQINEAYKDLGNVKEQTDLNFSHCIPNPTKDCKTMCSVKDMCLCLNRGQELIPPVGFKVNIVSKKDKKGDPNA